MEKINKIIVGLFMQNLKKLNKKRYGYKKGRGMGSTNHL